MDILNDTHIHEALETGEWNTVRTLIRDATPEQLCELLRTLRPHERILLYRLIPRKIAESVFELLDADEQNALVAHMADGEVRDALNAMTPDDRTALFEEMPSRVARKLMDLLPVEQRKIATMLLNYPPDSVGRLMTTAYVRVRPEWTCARVLEHIRRYGSRSETIWKVYVVNEKQELLDDVRVRQILLSDPEMPISELMDEECISLYTHQEEEQAVTLFRKYDLYAIPVVDANNVLLGIVTADDILAVDEEEATEDFQKLGMVVPLESRFSDARISQLVRSRIGWLLALVFVNIFSGAGIALFEGVIAKVVPLVFFLPLLIDSGGNSGSQSVTLTVRALATGNVRSRDWSKLLARECVISILLGVSMAAVVFLLGWYRGGWLLAMTVSIAMLAVIIMGSLLGQVLPFLLRSVGFDAATAGSPLVTSVADIFGVLLYFSIAYLVFGV